MSLRRILLLGIVASAVVSILHWRAAESPAGSEQAELTMGRLHARLAELEERVKALEERSHSAIVPAAGECPPAAGNAPYRPSEGPVPPNWKQGEINGLRYYTIPLGTTSPTAAPTGSRRW